MHSGELPLISVIVPSFQQGRFIERTLRSVLEQGYPRLQLLVFDGGSSDETLAILQKYSRRYRGVVSYVSEEDRSQAHAVNKGFAAARGQILGWLNSDDTYEPGALLRAARAFSEEGDCDVIYGHARYISADDEVIGPYPSRTEFDWQALADECYICQPTVFLHRRVVEGGHLLDESLDYCFDYDLWIRLGRRFKFKFIDRHLANARVHPAAKSVRFRSSLIDEAVRVVEDNYGFLPVPWALAQAHEERRRARESVSVDGLAWKAYSTAAWLCLRSNWACPGAWPRLLREIGVRAARKLRRTRRWTPSEAKRFGECEAALTSMTRPRQ